MNCDAKAYEGSEPFIFISYAHDDAHLVYPIVERLVLDGYRVWYDDGIQAGEDWTETVAARLGESAICIPMLTENYVRSVNCRNELAFSLNRGKTVISIKLTDFELPGSIELQLGNALYLEKYRYGETEFYERLQVSHGIVGCRDEASRITDGQLMAWRNKWANATPIRKANGEPDKVKLQAPELSKKAGGAPKKGLFLGLAAAVLVLAVLAIVLLPRMTKKESPAAAEAVTADTEAVQSFTLAGPVSDPDSAEVLPSRVYDCTGGLEISDVSCILYDQETKPLLEITVAWKNNTEVASLYAFAGATYPYDSKTVESYMENFYPLSGLPPLKGGTVSRFQKASTNMYFADLAYQLVMCLDAEGNVTGCIQLELGRAAEITEQGAGAAASSAPAITERQEMEILHVESTPGFDVKDIRCDVLGRGKNAWFEITVTWEHNTQVGTLFAFANSDGPFTAAEITENQKNFYQITKSPFLCDGGIEKVQTAYYDNVPAAGPVWLLLYCFDQDGTAVAYIMLEAGYPQEN